MPWDRPHCNPPLGWEVQVLGAEGPCQRARKGDFWDYLPPIHADIIHYSVSIKSWAACIVFFGSTGTLLVIAECTHILGEQRQNSNDTRPSFSRCGYARACSPIQSQTPNANFPVHHIQYWTGSLWCDVFAFCLQGYHEYIVMVLSTDVYVIHWLITNWFNNDHHIRSILCDANTSHICTYVYQKWTGCWYQLDLLYYMYMNLICSILIAHISVTI